MPRMSDPRPHTGGHRRTLDPDALKARLEHLLAQPISAARTAELRKVRSSLNSIANRSPRNGA